MATQKQKKHVISFKPKQVTKRLLSILEDRARDVLVSRYGLGAEVDTKTLEAIGQKYDITRERVRQIENHAITSIRKSEAYEKEAAAFRELERVIREMGGIVPEDELLAQLDGNESIKNHIHFLLVIGDPFKSYKEDKEFKHRWLVDEEISGKIHDSLRSLYNQLKDDELVPESEMINRFLENVSGISDEYRDDEIIRRWLALSKRIGKNKLDEWGKAHSPNINAKGMRDYAYLVIRRHGSPIHFREVAKAIEETFAKRAHVATTHNELIKDDRFVLVGRGLYALKDWGYVSGVVKDVIAHVLKKYGPLTKSEVIEKVMKERYVKENTILVNLQNPRFFKKDEEGKYHIVEKVETTQD